MTNPHNGIEAIRASGLQRASLWLMTELQRPLLLEGDAGVGKTEVAKTLAEVLDQPLIRLQCYEGLDVNTAVYEWNYQRQLLAIRRQEVMKCFHSRILEIANLPNSIRTKRAVA